MYIDEWGNEFKTIDEAKKFYTEKFNEVMKEEPVEILQDYLDESSLILAWIFEKHPELVNEFKKDFADDLKTVREDFIENRLWDLAEE